MSLFNRTCKVVVTIPNEDTLEIKDLATKFKVFKNTSRTSNTLDLEIYNLSLSTRNKILKKDNYIAVYAGYVDEKTEKLIFIGDITKAVTGYRLPEIVSIVEAGDGQKTLRETRVSVSFRERVSARSVLEKIAEQLLIPIREIKNFPDISYEHGFSYQGSASAGLDKVCLKVGFEWSIQNGEIQFVQARKDIQNEAIVLSPTSGMLNSPERIDDIGGQLLGDDPLPGWRVVCLLMPEIEPGMVVSLQAREVTGFFRVETVEHRGETHGEEWTSTIEVSELYPEKLKKEEEIAVVEG